MPKEQQLTEQLTEADCGGGRGQHWARPPRPPRADGAKVHVTTHRAANGDTSESLARVNIHITICLSKSGRGEGKSGTMISADRSLDPSQSVCTVLNLGSTSRESRNETPLLFAVSPRFREKWKVFSRLQCKRSPED